MATVLFSTTPGDREQDILQNVGSATVHKNVEITIDLGNTMDGSSRVISKEEVIHTLKRFIDFLVHGAQNQEWPPQ